MSAILLDNCTDNRTYRVDNGTETFIYREGSIKSGFDRENELLFYKEAEKLGVAPRLRESDTSKGVLVMDFIRGTEVKSEEAQQLLPQITALMHTLHSVKAPADATPAILSHIRSMAEKLKTIPNGWEKTIEQVVTALPTPEQLVFCHNDLAGNLIEEKGRLWAFDFECAGWNDPLFDLAFLHIWYGLDPKELLQSYFGNLEKEEDFTKVIRAALLFHALWSLVEDKETQAMELYEQCISMN